MKPRTRIISLLAFAAAFALSSAAFAGTAKVVTVEGKVVADKGGKSVELKVGDKVEQGSVIKTGAGAKCSIEWGKGHVVTVQPLSRLSVDSLAEESGGNTNLNIQAGRVQFRAEKLKGDEKFSISTPTAVAGVRGTFGEMAFVIPPSPEPIIIDPTLPVIDPIDAPLPDGGGDSEVILLEGNLGIETDAGEVNLDGGFMLEIDETGGIGEIEGIPADVLDGVLANAGPAITDKVSSTEVQAIKVKAESARITAPPTPKTEKKEETKEEKKQEEKKTEEKKTEEKKEEAKPAADKKTEEAKPTETKSSGETKTEETKSGGDSTPAAKETDSAPAAGGGESSSAAPETPAAAPEADAPSAPEAPEADAPEVDASAPEVDAPEVDAPEVDIVEIDDSVLDVLDQITDTVTTFTEEISPQ